MGDGISFQTKRALLELDRDMGGRQEPQQPQEPTNNRVGGLSAAEAQARAFGISVDELRKRQAAKFQELMNKRKGYADGGRVNGALEDFSTLSLPEKLRILARGGLLQFTNMRAAGKHDVAPERHLREFRSKPRYGLPRQRVDRNPLDVALNYAGGYDFANQPNVSMEDAIDLAKAYQLRDYMLATTKQRELDAQRDFGENVAGIVSAQVPTNYMKMMQNAADYGNTTERYREGGLVQAPDYLDDLNAFLRR